MAAASSAEFSKFLHDKNLQNYFTQFKACNLSLPLLLSLEKEEVKPLADALGLPIGARMRLQHALFKDRT